MGEVVHNAEILDASSAAELVRGEVDAQIATAKRFPRSPTKSLERARGLVMSSVDTAESCRYVLTRDKKRIEGGSIRLAEIIGNCWGNLRVQSRTISEGATSVVCQGVCIDLETNAAWSKEVRRRITYREGGRYSEDMITTTVNAAQSIAARNAVFSCVPRALWEPLLDDIRNMVRGDEKTFPARRQEMIAAFAKLRVDAETVARMMDRQRPDDITMDDLVDLRGIYTALRDGATTVEEELGEQAGAPAEPGTKTERVAKKLRGKSKDAAPPETTAQPAVTTGEHPASKPTDEPQAPPAAAEAEPVNAELYYRVNKAYMALGEPAKATLRERFKFKMIVDVKRWNAADARDMLGEIVKQVESVA